MPSRGSRPSAVTTLARVGAAVTVLLAGGCDAKGNAGGRSSPAPDEVSLTALDIGRFTQLSEGQAEHRELRLITTVPLGGRPEDTPASVSRGRISKNRIYISDQAGRRIRVYDRLGRSLFTLPTRRSGPGEIHNPVGLALREDTLVLVDIDPKRGLTAIDSAGRVAYQRPLRVGSSTVGVTSLGNDIAVATILLDADIVQGKGGFIHVVDDKGTSKAVGCAPDPLYRESLRAGGLYELFRFTGVSTDGDLLYCRQPITPVVQVLSPRGDVDHVIRIAPPFYRRGPDVPQSGNQMVLDRFRGTWWEHAHFFPLSPGFVAFYATYDTLTQQTRHRIFGCRGAGNTQDCYVADVPGSPIDVIAPDTLVVSRPLGRVGDVQQLAFYGLPR